MEDYCCRLRKLKDVSFPRVDEKNWFRLLDETKWLNHIQVHLSLSFCEEMK